MRAMVFVGSGIRDLDVGLKLRLSLLLLFHNCIFFVLKIRLRIIIKSIHPSNIGLIDLVKNLLN